MLLIKSNLRLKTIQAFCNPELFEHNQHLYKTLLFIIKTAWPRSAVSSTSDSKARGLGFDTWSGHILSFLLLLIQEGRLSVTGKMICTKYWLTIKEV